MREEYHDKREEYMDNRTPEQTEREEERKQNEKFAEEVNKAYDILWELMSPGNNSYIEGNCKYGMANEYKLRNIIRVIDKELGR